MEGEGGRVCHPPDRPRSGDPLLHAGPGRLPHRGRPVHRPAARRARRKAPGGPPWLRSVTRRDTPVPGREPPASKPPSPTGRRWDGGRMSTPAAPGAPVVIDRIDHLVLTVADLDQTIDFYVRVLGMQHGT